ncbi:ABC transporter permease, partial [Streptomyces daliensis]|nr:ABC transporter permease [Streptomyces daliensis]
ATLLVAVAILAEAGMSFLGLGIQLPDISLGQMIGSARTAVTTRPWLFYPPGVLLVLICLTINCIGEGLRDALDPQQTRVRR